MQERRSRVGAYVKKLIAGSPMPRNQVAAFSGLSNTYIRDLEAGNYSSVPREKLIFLAVSLNLNLRETDELLAVFDRRNLAPDDIPAFIGTCGRRRRSAALLPLRDGVPLDLALLSAERLSGPHLIVAPVPSYCLMAPGHRRHVERHDESLHPLHGELVEAISRARAENLRRQLERHPVRQFICRDCLLDYARNPEDAQDERFRKAHLENLVEALRDHPNFSLHLTAGCPTSAFTLKLVPPGGRAPESAAADKLIIVFWPRHAGSRRKAGRLSGFTTDNPIFIQNFKDEIEGLERTVVPEYRDRGRLVSFLTKLSSR
jgi:hypothetical protein